MKFLPSTILIFCICAAVIISGIGENHKAQMLGDKEKHLDLRDKSPLTRDELQFARHAWAYFEANTQVKSGLVNSVANYNSTTLWDQGSYIYATISANRLDLISNYELISRMKKLLSSTKALELTIGGLPNKAYNTATLQMTDYKNIPVAQGVGWSGIDIARFLGALDLLRRYEPKFDASVNEIIGSWKIQNLQLNGYLAGSITNESKYDRLQEGRVGYEQYSSLALLGVGIILDRALSNRDHIAQINISGADIPYDTRSFEIYHAITPVLSEPYYLIAFEYELNGSLSTDAQSIFLAQKERYKETGIFTAVTEDHLDLPPYFLYSTVFGNGLEWAVLDENGANFPHLRTQSTKASFSWYAIFDDPYAEDLRNNIVDTYKENEGWMAGRYEFSDLENQALSLNTNAIILEALHFQVYGSFSSIR